ncbi:MAG: hypothetical protein AAB974_00455 [Patescibacteria group bacterium]
MSPPEAGLSHEPQKPSRELRERIPIIVSPVAEISGELGNVEAQVAEAQKMIEKRYGRGANIGMKGIEGQQRERQKAEAGLEPLLARRQELKSAQSAALRKDTEALRSHYDRDIARSEQSVEDHARALGEGMEALRQEKPQAIEAHTTLEANIVNIERLAQMDPQMAPGLEQAAQGMRKALGNSEVSRLRQPLEEAQRKLERKSNSVRPWNSSEIPPGSTRDKARRKAVLTKRRFANE